MEWHLRREIFLYSTYEINLVNSRQLYQIDMSNDEEAIKDVFIDFETFKADISHVLHLITLNVT